MATTPAQDLVDSISASVAALTKGTNLFHGPYRDVDTDANIPVTACFVLASGGPAPLAYMSNNFEGVEHRRSAIQIMIRSARDDFAGGLTLARSVRDAIHHVDVTGYFNVEVLESEPNHFEVTDDQSHRFTINAIMWHRQ